ncbi:MAG TPA: hypothetical protein VGO67_24950 [Verrucomicrobiae bacterium]|jgi:hypothetical protein
MVLQPFDWIMAQTLIVWGARPSRSRREAFRVPHFPSLHRLDFSEMNHLDARGSSKNVVGEKCLAGRQTSRAGRPRSPEPIPHEHLH